LKRHFPYFPWLPRSESSRVLIFRLMAAAFLWSSEAIADSGATEQQAAGAQRVHAQRKGASRRSPNADVSAKRRVEAAADKAREAPPPAARDASSSSDAFANRPNM